MRRTIRYLLVLAAIAVAIPVNAAPSGKTADSVWVMGVGSDGLSASATPTMSYGDRFSAGWQSSRISQPWGLMQCWDNPAKDGAPFVGGWRALQSDGSIGVFELFLTAPGATWPADGATCNVSLVSLQGNKRTVTAVSDDFFVAA